jgi:hypothetical protein
VSGGEWTPTDAVAAAFRHVRLVTLRLVHIHSCAATGTGTGAGTTTGAGAGTAPVASVFDPAAAIALIQKVQYDHGCHSLIFCYASLFSTQS